MMMTMMMTTTMTMTMMTRTRTMTMMMMMMMMGCCYGLICLNVCMYTYMCVCCLPYALPTKNVLLYYFSRAECCEEAIEAHGIP